MNRYNKDEKTKKLKKVEKDMLSIPSIRGTRYFGPSKMSFFNLLKHSYQSLVFLEKLF
mgnify:CR=1 FL=1